MKGEGFFSNGEFEHLSMGASFGSLEYLLIFFILWID